MKTIEEFIKLNCTETLDLVGLNQNFVLNELTKVIKEYALEIANDAFDEGFTYGIGSHKDFIQTRLNKSEYLQKLKNEI